jgi:hypothetical protein
MAEKVIIDLEVKSNKGVKDVQKLNTEISKTNKEVKKTNEELSGATNTLDKFSGGAVSKFKNFKTAVGSLSNGFKSLKVAIIGTGIGALLIGILAVKAAFTSSEEGQNKFAKLMGIIGSITGNLVDMLANLGEGIINAFTNPKQALIDFKNLIVENITNRFNAIIDTLGFLGSAFKKVFSGDFKGALEDAKSAGSSYVDALTGIEDSINKVANATKGLVTELKEEAKIAGQIADQRAIADKLERGLIVERAEANRKRAELLEQAANKEKFTAQERIEFLTEAGKIEEEITKKEIESARLRFEAKVAENALSKSTKEDLDEEANLKAKLIDLETARLTKSKLVTSQIVAAKREEKARLKAIDDEAITQRNERLELEANTEEEKRILALEKEKTKFDEAIALATEQGLATEELERSQKESLQTMRDGFHKKDIDEKQKNTDESNKIAKEQKDYKEQQYRSTYSNLQTILSVGGKKLEKVGKALAIADVIRSSVKSVSETVSATGVANAKAVAASPLTGGMPFVAINSVKAALSVGATIAGAAKSIQSIKGNSKNVSPPPALPNSGGGGGGGSIPSIPPAFNVVGASDTNQLASAIGGQSQQPIQAFVVSNDVTTAQEMDRNIIEGASI